MEINYSKLFFGKDIVDLKYDDIVNYFVNSREESDKIEFKSYYSDNESNHKEKENTIIKTICALLNSEGGIIIWGAPIGKTTGEKNEKIFIGELSPLNILIEKDRFINKIADSITSTPRGVKFQPLQKDSKFVYIIEVEKSLYSPHQFQNVYYMRLDGQTRKAPHHYIEAMFKKVTFPKLEGYIRPINFNQSKESEAEVLLNLTIFIFNKSKLQNEHELYYRLITSCGKFLSYLQAAIDQRKNYQSWGKILSIENARATLYYSEVYSISETIVINYEELEKQNYRLELTLYFGGKNSPLMASEYILKLDNAELSDLNKALVSIKENIYIHELSNDEKSESEQLREILGR